MGRWKAEKEHLVSLINQRIATCLNVGESLTGNTSQIRKVDVRMQRDYPRRGTSEISLELCGPSKQFSSLIIHDIKSFLTRFLQSIVEIRYEGLSPAQSRTLEANLGNDSDSKRAFVADLNTMLKASGSDKTVYTDDIKVETGRKVCTLAAVLIGHGPFIPEILLKLEDKAHEIGINSDPAGMTQRSKLSGPERCLDSLYYKQLSSSIPPPSDTLVDRNSKMIYVAHAAVWMGGCCIYGGFIRDLLIRNEDANDIDIGYSPSKTNLEDVKHIILNAVKVLNLKCTEISKGENVDFAIRLTGSNHRPFDVDLVNMEEMKRTGEPPGVDCDVGNFLIENTGNHSIEIRLKVGDRRGLLSFEESKKHCEMKQFVFYYNLETKRAKERLRKYLERGWICLTQLPEDDADWARSSGYSTLLKPRPEYSISFSSSR